MCGFVLGFFYYVNFTRSLYKAWLHLLSNFSQKKCREMTVMKHVPVNVVSEERMQKSSESTEKIVSTMYLGYLFKESDLHLWSEMKV